MTRQHVARYLRPWTFAGEEMQRRLDAVRKRDGDNCRRCRRPLHFDLPRGHDKAPKLEQVGPATGSGELDNLCLCHGRCNHAAGDATAEVHERMALKG